MKKLTVVVPLLLALNISYAQTVYKSEKNGVITYSENHIPGSTPVRLPELSIVNGKTTPRNNSGLSLPAVPNSSSSSTTLLPPPPPSLSNNVSSSIPEKMTIEEARAALENAKKDLSEQESVRLGDEKNYQKKLDRVKPFEDKVSEFTQRLDELKKATQNKN